MNKTQKSFFAFTLLAFVGQVSAGCSGVTSFFSPRSQGVGVNAARDMVGWQELINQCDKECFYAAFTFDYSQTFSGIKDNEKYVNKKGVAYRKVMNKTICASYQTIYAH